MGKSYTIFSRVVRSNVETSIFSYCVGHVNNLYDLLISKVAYTYDAGPNACLYLLDKDVPLMMSLIGHFYPSENKTESFIRGPEISSVDISKVQ